MNKGWIIGGTLAGFLLLGSCSVIGSYNGLVSEDEGVKAQWSQVENQYQRRSDLIPNLVEVVKGYAGHERETLEAVIKARASATQMTLPKEAITNPELLKQYEANQGALTAALGRLMVVSEKYPDLKANEQFRNLQVELAGTENRIAVARRDYITHARDFNAHIRKFPTNIVNSVVAGLKPATVFEADQGAKVAPKVSFSK